ncbi:uncharacterized protein METZ01_LOCUS302957 [marine metagenome]|uniref:TM2 domain-containing protein n=1 Tax=marine metagenome TaxID=408172 RepID=A0A382MM95_9ZZZZ
MTNVNIYQQNDYPISPREWHITLILCFFVGIWGVHRFYVGKIGTGILMFFTLGGLGLWLLIDLIMIACAAFRDKEGRSIPYSSVGNLATTSHTVTNNSSSVNPSSDKKFDVHVASELRELSSLKEEGILTEEEFNKKKKELLNL